MIRALQEDAASIHWRCRCRTRSNKARLGENVFRGFPLFQVDLAVQRTFRITKRISIKGRVEAFNLFNHPNFSPESGEMGTLDSSGRLLPQNGFGLSQATLAQGLAGGQLGTFGSGFSPLYQIGELALSNSC